MKGKKPTIRSKKFQNFISEATVYKSKRWKFSSIRFKVGENSLFIFYDFNPTNSALVLDVLRIVRGG